MRSEVFDFKMYPTTSNGLDVTDLRGSCREADGLYRLFNYISYIMKNITSKFTLFSVRLCPLLVLDRDRLAAESLYQPQRIGSNSQNVVALKASHTNKVRV